MAIRAMAITPVSSTDQDAQPRTPAVNTHTLTDTQNGSRQPLIITLPLDSAQRRDLAGAMSPSQHIRDWMHTQRNNANGVSTVDSWIELSDHSSNDEPMNPARDLITTRYRCAPGCGCGIHKLQAAAHEDNSDT